MKLWLCHSLVRSEQRSTVDGQRSTQEQKVQVCDATKFDKKS